MPAIPYDQPPELPRSSDFRVFADGKEITVLHSEEGAVACFAVEGGAVRLQVTTLWGDPHHAVYRPLARGRPITLDHDQLTLELPGAEKCLLEFDRNKRLFVFADPASALEPPDDTENWRIFEAGKVHDVGEVRLATGESCWLQPGAVVRGRFFAENAEGAVIRGPGILLGDFQEALGPVAVMEGGLRPTFELAGCRDVEVRDLLILDSRSWTTVLVACEDVCLSNHKVVTWSISDDGVDIVGSRDIRLTDSFICSRDDCVAVKASDYTPFLATDGARDISGIRVEDCLFMNADCGNALEIGFELKTDSVRDIRFADCDILHTELEGNRSGSALSVHCGNWATVEAVIFEDIRIEQAMDKLFDLGIFHSPYDTDTRRGMVRDITFREIRLLGAMLPRSFIYGEGPEHEVSEVRLENFRTEGPPYRSVLNNKFGLPPAVDAWPTLPLHEAIRETLVLRHARTITLDGTALA